MAQYRKYEQYKDSGVEWIGEIPEWWKLERIGSLYKFVNEKVSDEEYPALSVTKQGIVPQMENVAKTMHGDNRKKVTIGDFVINSRADRPGSCGVSNFDGSVSVICHVMRPINNKFWKEYGHFLFRNNRFSQEFYKWGRGIVDDLWSTRQDEMKKIMVPVPTVNEQIEIANFLDQKTAEIDSLIADKEKLIALLEEQRQAIITEAVTKGLNPDVKMKDSGVEWIDNIPEYWCVSKLSHVALVKARLGWKGLTASEYVDDGYIFLATPNIKTNKIDFENVNYITAERYYESPEIMLDLNDVLLAKDGTLGTVNVVRELPRPATVNSSIAVIRPQQEKLSGVFLYYFLASNCMQNVIQRMKDGMGVPHLFQRDINKFDILVPPLEEQIQIVNFLEIKTAEIGCLVVEIEEQLSKLREYRQSLIFEAVTGKIDIRDTIVEPTVV